MNRTCPHCGLQEGTNWSGIPYCQQPWSGSPEAKPNYPNCLLRSYPPAFESFTVLAGTSPISGCIGNQAAPDISALVGRLELAERDFLGMPNYVRYELLPEARKALRALEAERDRWIKMYEAAQNANSYRQSALETWHKVDGIADKKIAALEEDLKRSRDFGFRTDQERAALQHQLAQRGEWLSRTVASIRSFDPKLADYYDATIRKALGEI